MAKASKKVTVENIKGRDSVRFGRVVPGPRADGHHAEIEPRVSIRLFGTDTNRKDGPKAYDRTFKLGDVAEYDSYNMHYTGRIVSIGEKTIGILPESSSYVRRIEIYEFSWRNRGLDLDAIAVRNLDVMASC